MKQLEKQKFLPPKFSESMIDLSNYFGIPEDQSEGTISKQSLNSTEKTVLVQANKFKLRKPEPEQFFAASWKENLNV